MTLLVLSALCFFSGVWFSLSVLKVGGSVSVATFSLAVFLCSFSLILLFGKSSKLGRRILVCVLLVFLGIARGLWDIKTNPEPRLAAEILGENVTLEGCIASPVDTRITSASVILDISSISGGQLPEDFNLKVSASLPRNPEVFYGDCISLSGKLLTPEDFKTDSGKTFGYKDFLWKDYVSYRLGLVRNFEITSEDPDKNKIVAALERIKKWFEARIYTLFENPYAGLLSGELLGSRSFLSKELQDDFRISGVIHVIVLSGYNVALVISVIGKVFQLFSRRFAIVGSLVGVVGFAILVGGGATVIRASLMGLLIVYASAFGRVYTAMRALIIVSVFMVLWSPRILLFDIGFQMSVLATAGMILFSGRIEDLLPRFIPTFLQMRQNLAATISAQLAVLPILILKIGELSVVSLLANMLILFMVPVSMLLGFLAVCISFLFFPLGYALAWIAQGTLWFQVSLASLFAKFPLGVVSFADASPVLVMVFWLFSITVFMFYGKKKNKKAT